MQVDSRGSHGRFSVHAGGAKLVGTAGRRRRDAALVGGVIVVTDADPLRAIVGAVYAALDLPCDLTTVGSVADCVDTADDTDLFAAVDQTDAVEVVTDALVTALAALVPLDPAPLPAQVVADARAAIIQPAVSSASNKGDPHD